MAIALVNTAFGTNQTASTFPSIATGAFAATAGNLIVAVARVGNAADLPSLLTDTAGNTYVRAISQLNSGTPATLSIWYAKNILGNGSNVVTAKFPQNEPFSGIITLQYSGADKVVPLDITTGANAAVTGSFSTRAGNEVIVCGASANSVTQTLTAGLIGGSGSTLERADGAAAAEMMGVEDLLVTAVQSSITAAMTGLGATPIMALATFRSASNGAGAVINNFNSNPITYVTDQLVPWRSLQTLNANQWGLRVSKVVISTTGVSVAGRVQVTDPNDGTILLNCDVPSSMTTPIVFNFNRRDVAWRDFIVTGPTATNTVLQIWYGA